MEINFLKNSVALTMNILLITLLILGVIGCSNKAVYENIRINQRNDCIKEPPPAYDECIERTNKSYEEYQRERNGASDK
jgi:hypothetical protein